MPGDIQDSSHCRALVDRAVSEFGGLDILVNNAVHQATLSSLDEITDEEWEMTFRTNIHAMFWLARAAVPHLKKKGGCIINTASINSDAPNPTRLPYATTKGAIHNFTGGLAQMLAKDGIRVRRPLRSFRHTPTAAITPESSSLPRTFSQRFRCTPSTFGRSRSRQTKGGPIRATFLFVQR